MRQDSLGFMTTVAANMTYQNFSQTGPVSPPAPVAPSTLLQVSQDEVIRNYPHTKRVGGYLLGRTIGEGSFAKVKEGIHVLTGEKVAVKIIDKKKAKEDAYVRRNMRREGRLLQQVRHHNIIQLFETLETENSYYIVTEYCGGGDLMSRICSRKRLDEAETRKYIRQVVSAVDYLHKAGIVHRDLKVENLLLNERKDVKIIDFGLSNSFRSTESKELSGVADELCVTQCGSPAYAAPELLSNSKYGPKVDIWSIGVNMYAMLTGNLPFTVDPFTIKSLLNKMINGDMNPIPEHLSKNCKELLRRFLTADPDERITLPDAMHHPWITDGRNKPIDPAPYPNRLTAVDLNQTVLKHMATQLDFKLGEVLRQVTSNIPCSATSTYHLLLRKLDRYREGVVKGSRPGLPRSDTTLGLRRTPRTIATVQQREFLPANATPSNAHSIDPTTPPKRSTEPSDRTNDDEEVTEKNVGISENNNNNGGNSDDNNNNNDDDQQHQAVIIHQRLDSNAGQTDYSRLLSDAPSPSSPVIDNRTSTENKENRLKFSRTVQPNRKGSYSRDVDVKFNKLTRINSHPSVPTQPSQVTEEALFDLSPKVKGQGYDHSHVSREPNQRPVSDLPLIPGSTGQYVTNTWTLANQRTRPGVSQRGESGARAAPTSKQPSRSVTGSRSSASGCGGQSSRASDTPPTNLFLAPLVKAEVTSVPVKVTSRRYLVDEDHCERRTSRERRAMFFTPRPHQWRANQVKPLTANPGGFLTERRRTTITERTASTEEDGVGRVLVRGLGRVGGARPGQKTVNFHSIENDGFAFDQFGTDVDSEQPR